LDTLAVDYDAGVELVDYQADPEAARALINNWVMKKTSDLVREVLPAGSLDPLTRLVLVNALRLYASWSTVFKPTNTQAQSFYGIGGETTVDFMHGWPIVYYAAGSGWVAVDVPYYGDQLVWTAVMPDAGQFDTVKASLDAAWLTSLDATSQHVSAALEVPKFKLVGPTVSWQETLQALGMTTLFDPNTCNLQGINPTAGLYVQNVFQQASLELLETGTDAAAATVVVVPTKSADVGTVTVVLDRPFLFFLRERGGPVLFAGQVVSLPVAN
jgi:serpin B